MSTERSLLGRLFHAIWSVVVFLYRAVMVVFALAVVVSIWVAVRGGTPARVENNVALVIYPTGQLVDTLTRDPGQQFAEQILGAPPSETLLRDLVEALQRGAKDPRIALAVLKLDHLDSAGLPQMEELAAAVDEFRASGKPVYAYGPEFDQLHYLPAAHASEISLDPMGGVDVLGFGVYDFYFKDALDKLGVTVNVFRVGEYKSAVEPFLRNNMSDEARAANQDWLGDLWRVYGTDVGRARRLAEGGIDQYVARMPAGVQALKGDAAAYAKESKLADNIETLEQFRARIGKKVGMDPDHGSFRQVNQSEYLSAIGRDRKSHARKIGLVVVQGEIVDGDSNPGQAGGDTVAELLSEARRDDSVAAVVLRVDSPGGSVSASERIRREIHELKQAHKPVVVSMGSVAASGGYWISMDADQIWAHDATITGSIGIFGLFPTIVEPLNKLGIHTDGVGTTALAGAFRMDRPLTPDAANMIQSQVEYGYHQFITGVAAGRHLAVEKVDGIARGRVWSGAHARSIGLVDQLGGLDQAVAAAAKLASLSKDDYELEEIQAPRTVRWAELLRYAGDSSLAGLLPNSYAGALRPSGFDALARKLSWLKDPRGIYAWCPCQPVLGRR